MRPDDAPDSGVEYSAPTAFDRTIEELRNGTLRDVDKYKQDVECPACHGRATVRCSVPFDIEWESWGDLGTIGFLVPASRDPVLNFWMTVDGALAESWQWLETDPPERIFGERQGEVHSCVAHRFRQPPAAP